MECRNDLKREYLYRSVMTASPTELVVMLFDACIKNIKLAMLAMEGKPDYMRTGDCLVKAQKIICELMASLDMELELSQSLMPIYQFLLTTLRNANVTKDMSVLPEALDILTSQRDTWSRVASCPGERKEALCV